MVGSLPHKNFVLLAFEVNPKNTDDWPSIEF